MTAVTGPGGGTRARPGDAAAVPAFAAPVEDILAARALAAAWAGREVDDPDLEAEVIRHFARFAEAVIAPLNAPGDAAGCRLDSGRVRMPPGFAAAVADWAAQGWPGLALPGAQGGQGLPDAVQAAVSEIFAGACHALQMVTGLGPGAARTLIAFGTPAQQARWLPRLAAGEVLATMCLTEPDAGSDLSAIRCRAVAGSGAGAGGWRIEGEKIFISGGDHDLGPGILHLVLARTGPRALGLFLCPAEDGAGGGEGANAISVLRIEEKMGLHASPTCHLRFDGARAEPLGPPDAGLAAMFTLMNHARLDVALQGVAHAARAAALAAAHAGTRRQGRRPDGAPAVLADHPGVAEMLAEQQALALGGRLMCHRALAALDGPAEEVALASFLTPVCKVFCTAAGVRAAGLGIQVLGGYGYLREYGLEQISREARVTLLYEGANGIHALALATRHLGPKGRAGAAAFGRMLAEAPDPDGTLAAGRALWEARRSALAADPDPAPRAEAFMQLTATLFWQAAWGWIRAGGPAGSTGPVAGPVSGPASGPAAAYVARTAPARARYWAALCAPPGAPLPDAAE